MLIVLMYRSVRPYMDTIQAVPANSSDIASHMYTVCFNYYCMNVTTVSYLSTVSLTQLDEIITFYSLYNYQSIFYHWHIKPIGSCYSSIMEIWHHRGRQFCIIPGDEVLFCFEYPKVGNLRNSKDFIQSMQDCTVICPQSTPSPVSLAFLWDSPITLNEKLV